MGAIEEIRTKADLFELVSEVVDLNEVKSGRYKGCCPFHTESTPSFTVDSNKYYCFGCGEGGDAIRFVQRTQKLSFGETLKWLGDRYGIQADNGVPRRIVPRPKRKPAQGIKQPRGYVAPSAVPACGYDAYAAELLDDVRSDDYDRLLTLGIVPSELVWELMNDVRMSNL